MISDAHIALYDSRTIDQLIWPHTEEARQAKDLLLPMMKEGVESFIRNVNTRLYLLHVHQQIIPITVNTHEYDNSYLTSNFFPIKYLEEKLSEKKYGVRQVSTALVRSAGLILKGFKINKVVNVNNWLLTTNIYPQLSDATIQEITHFLIKQFPDHIIIFRSLNSHKCQHLTSELSKEKYRVLFARHVNLYDPQKKEALSSKAKYHHRRDRRLFETEGYEIARCHDITAEDEQRMLQLYNQIYLTKHTSFSPQYTPKFVQETLKKKFIEFVLIKREGKIQGFMGFHERAGTLIAPFCGYDTSYGDANHLYRMMTMLAIDEAEKRSLLLNDGSGGESCKQYRGMKPCPEYIALYDRHLPIHRRLFWGLAETCMKHFAKT